LSAAFDAALTKLGLVDRDDPASVVVAKRIAARRGAWRAPAPHRFSVEVRLHGFLPRRFQHGHSDRSV
jgi:hypothetical protein